MHAIQEYKFKNLKAEFLVRRPSRIERLFKRRPEYYLSLANGKSAILLKIGENSQKINLGPLEISSLLENPELTQNEKSVAARISIRYRIYREHTAEKEPAHTFYKVLRSRIISLN